MPDFNQYVVSSADWRKTIRANQHKTYIIITLFFLIYCAVGLLADLAINVSNYPEASLTQLFLALITFKLFPIATILMLAIAGVSLFISYALYDKLMLLGTQYHEVTPQNAQNTKEQQLYNTVEEMKIAAGLHYMPKIFIIDADYMNAFASGYSEKSAMIAITQGLLNKLTRDELQAVMAHELSHIRHLDIKLTLTASLLANFSIIVLDILFRGTLYSSRRSDSRSKNSLATIILILRFVLPIINIFLLLYLSRKRELMADAGCVELMRANQPLASALLKIQEDHQQNHDQYLKAYQSTPHEDVRREAYIFDPHEAGIASLTSINDLFSTHPTLEERLTALGFKKTKNNP